jgi:uncharacterized membrane protein
MRRKARRRQFQRNNTAPLAAGAVIGYSVAMLGKRLITTAVLIVLAATLSVSLGGCSKCGWIWDDAGVRPKSCLTDAPTR